MTTEINTYFAEKKAIMEAYYEERRALRDAKDAAYGRNDYEEGRRLLAEADKMTCPMTEGACMAIRFWKANADTMIADDHLWTKDIHDFVTCLREAGVKTFLFADHSTALMESIHEFVKEGLTLVGPETYTEECCWSREPQTRLALRFTF